MTTNIYVKILNEDIHAWRPVKAVCLKENIFKIVDKTDFEKLDEMLEFGFDDTVVCKNSNGNFYAVKLYS
ncbi:hypothetical protein [Campylobacter concisus]|jgi:hypothetical protein|uniref:hypothetical protein n=1 Tax=Campylobacter concisus TaxID=199 RepID=UPI000D376264|nr:hypothetical protein [Campylobacter concisus]